jgi:hypothetical protein
VKEPGGESSSSSSTDDIKSAGIGLVIRRTIAEDHERGGSNVGTITAIETPVPYGITQTSAHRKS